MTRLPVALACLILAALFAAVAVVLARPRWRWEPDTRDLDGEPFCPSGYAQRYHRFGACACGTRHQWAEDWNDPAMDVYNYATAWSAAVNTPDDAARWAGG